MNKLFIVALLVACIIVPVGATFAADNQIKIATDIPYKPMEFMKPDGTFTGFDIDLGNALCEQAELECTWVDQTWTGIIPGLMSHRYDAIMSSMMRTPRRKKHVLFSNAYIFLGSSFFVPKDSPINDVSLPTLEGKSIGVQRGTTQDDYLTAKYSDIAEINRYQHADDMVLDMTIGRLDIVFVAQITGQNALIEAHPGEFRKVGKMITKPKEFFGDGVGIAFRKNDKELSNKFDKALQILKKNGTYEKIYKKYFHQAPPEDKS